MTNPTLGKRLAHRLGANSSGLNKIAGNVGWLFVDRVVRMGFGLVMLVWVARYLGPDRFGGLNFATAFVGLFGTVATLGLDIIVVREVINSPENLHEILGTAFVLRSVVGLLVAVLSVVTVHLLQPHDAQALLLVSILSLTLIFQSFDAIDSFFQSQVRSKLTVLAKNLAFLVFVVVRGLLVIKKAPLWMFAAAFSGEIILGAVGLLIGYRVVGGDISFWHSTRKRAATLLRQSWPVIFSSMAIMVYMRVDTVMLKMMKGDFEVGLYAAATRISEVWYFIPMAIASSVTPAIIKMKNNPVLFNIRIKKLLSLMTFIALTIGSAIALFSNRIVHTLYSNAYVGAGPVLAVHIWASVFVFLGVAQAPWDTANDLLKLSLYRTIAGAVINVAMNFYLIPRYAAMGAAISTVVSYAFSSVFANVFSARTRPIFYLQMRSFLPYRFWA